MAAEWIISTKTRRQTWQAWLMFMVLVVLLLIAQTIGGAWTGAVPRAWAWLLGNLLPSLAVLLASLLLERSTRTMIPPGAHAALVGGTTIYGLLTLLSLFSVGMNGAEEMSSIERLEQSYWWLMPIQAVLLGGYYLAFFRGEAVFHPNEQLIHNAAKKYALDAARKGRPVQEKCRNHIVSAQYEMVFQLMGEFFQKNSSNNNDELLLLQSQYANLKREREEGLIDPANAQIQLNRITAALLNLTEQIKE